jgi:S1-C subfamily serine protease
MRQWLVGFAVLAMAGDGVAAKHETAESLGNLKGLYDGLAPAVVIVYPEILFSRGVGSGVIVHRAGYIVTAAHVVEQAMAVSVEFKDQSTAPAQIVTLSRTEDVALLKVDAIPKGTFVPVLGDSGELEVGDPVFAIGAPLGLKHTLTTGIISAVRGDFGSELAFLPKNVIQTDAAINQGNSGGALFNAKGQVIGIASFLATPTGGNVGLGFAVPSNTVRRRLFDDAIPYLGMGLRRIPDAMAEVLNWPVHKALLVERVQPGSPAAEAGIRGGEIEAEIGGVKLMLGGDIILKVGDIDIAEAEGVHAFLHALEPGDTIPYTLLRRGETVQVEVKVETLIPVPKLEPLEKGGKRRKL